jgi:hypothetical protein
MKKQLTNPNFWCLVAVVAGIAIFIWGGYRNDAIGNYRGAGFLMWTGSILAAAGLIGWQVFGKGKKL